MKKKERKTYLIDEKRKKREKKTKEDALKKE